MVRLTVLVVRMRANSRSRRVRPFRGVAVGARARQL